MVFKNAETEASRCSALQLAVKHGLGMKSTLGKESRAQWSVMYLFCITSQHDLLDLKYSTEVLPLGQERRGVQVTLQGGPAAEEERLGSDREQESARNNSDISSPVFYRRETLGLQ
eukprot:3994631-Amphidinium_carterae.1